MRGRRLQMSSIEILIYYRMVYLARVAAVTMRGRFLELSLFILIAEYYQSRNLL